jgi:hypothetical protein
VKILVSYPSLCLGLSSFSPREAWAFPLNIWLTSQVGTWARTNRLPQFFHQLIVCLPWGHLGTQLGLVLRGDVEGFSRASSPYMYAALL